MRPGLIEVPMPVDSTSRTTTGWSFAELTSLPAQGDVEKKEGDQLYDAFELTRQGEGYPVYETIFTEPDNEKYSL
jgi:hypothetical protein